MPHYFTSRYIVSHYLSYPVCGRDSYRRRGASSGLPPFCLAFVLCHAKKTAEPQINAHPNSDTMCGIVWKTMPSRARAKTICVYTMLTATSDFSACNDRVMRNCWNTQG